MLRCRRYGFTLIELLVVIAIIALLMSILMPALGRAREQARQVVCLTNLKGLGNAINTYAGEYREFIPPMQWRQGSGAETEDTWVTLLDKGEYVSASKAENRDELPEQNTIFKCPSGAMELADSGTMPDSQTDSAGARATAHRRSDEDFQWDADNKYIHTWYGANAAIDPTERFPFGVSPDNSGNWNVLTQVSSLRQPSEVVGLYDGIWAHNSGENGWKRINARHLGATETNVMFLDGSADSLSAENLPKGGPLEEESTYGDDHHWSKWAIDPLTP